MKYAQVRTLDIANGPGIRVTLFVTGCPFHCTGCFNEAYQDFQYGTHWNDDIQQKFIKLGQVPFVDGYNILGGEPLAQGNAMLNLLRDIKEQTGKSIWMWTGFQYENLNELQHQTLRYVDVLVDGQYKENQHRPNLLYRGSSNQRLIDVQASLQLNQIIKYKNPPGVEFV